VDPVGAGSPVKVDIRLISATNRDLREMVAAGRFREDLYYRIGVFPMTLPPLRERREDLPGLARMFLSAFAAEAGMAFDGFSEAAMEAIVAAPWPGNVRQLQNTIQRAVIMADGSMIRPQDLHGLEAVRAAVAGGSAMQAEAPSPPSPLLTAEGHIRRLLDIEAEAIALAVKLYRGRMAETARRLGIGRSTLYRKIDELQLGEEG
jgi:DNA-binding NtrC family response regulator